MNKKGLYSQNIQTICDAPSNIVNVRHAGSTQDSFISRNSVIQQFFRGLYLSGGRNILLLCDSAHPLQPYLLTFAAVNTSAGR